MDILECKILSYAAIFRVALFFTLDYSWIQFRFLIFYMCYDRCANNGYKRFLFKNGLLYFSSQDEEYKCFEFSGRASVYEAVQQYNHVYMICDNSNYFYTVFFFRGLLNAYVLII